MNISPITTFKQGSQTLVNVVLLTCFGLLAACRSTHYELEMQVDGDKLQRRLSVWTDAASDAKTEFGKFSLEDLDQIAAAYQVELPENLAAKHEFAGSFGPHMPADIGGEGWLLAWPTSLGTTYIYSEQFRGNDAIHAGLQRKLTAADRIIDVVIAWLRVEFSESDDLQQVVTGFDGQLRADLLDLAVYDWVDSTVTAEEFASEDVLFRIAQYFANRGYFDPLLLPEYFRITLEAENADDLQPIISIVARGLASRMGLSPNAPLPDIFAAIVEDWPHYQESFEQFAEDSDVLQGIPLLNIDLGLGVTTGGESLTAVLHMPSEPLETNGEWMEETATLEWQMPLASDHELSTQIPNMLVAMWVSPSVDFQLEHFGHVAFNEEFLSEYCLWRNGLTPSHGKQWDDFLESLVPDTGLAVKIDAFRFADKPKVDDTNEHLYEMIDQLAEEL